MKRKYLFFFPLIFLCIFTNTVVAFEKKTHEAINLRIAESRINEYLKTTLGFKDGANETFNICFEEFYKDYENESDTESKKCSVKNLT